MPVVEKLPARQLSVRRRVERLTADDVDRIERLRKLMLVVMIKLKKLKSHRDKKVDERRLKKLLKVIYVRYWLLQHHDPTETPPSPPQDARRGEFVKVSV
jgi:hypothetical protein